MTLKTASITIATGSRDQGKRFLITEMPAAKAEAWGMRALGAMSRSGIDMPLSILNSGLLGFKLIGLRAFLAAPWSDVEPLLKELMACVQIVEPAITRPIIDEDTEEISTLVRLREEVLHLHLGFRIAADLLEAVAAAQTIETTLSSPTARASSEPSSQAA